MDVSQYVDNVRRCTAELKRRNAEATARARAELPRIVEAIRATPGIKRAYLFGSLVKGTFHPGSDIDIAVEGLEPEARYDLISRLERLAQFAVDLRDLDGSPGFRRVVEAYGEVLHADG